MIINRIAILYGFRNAGSWMICLVTEIAALMISSRGIFNIENVKLFFLASIAKTVFLNN